MWRNKKFVECGNYFYPINELIITKINKLIDKYNNKGS